MEPMSKEIMQRLEAGYLAKLRTQLVVVTRVPGIERQFRADEFA